MSSGRREAGRREREGGGGCYDTEADSKGREVAGGEGEKMEGEEGDIVVDSPREDEKVGTKEVEEEEGQENSVKRKKLKVQMKKDQEVRGSSSRKGREMRREEDTEEPHPDDDHFSTLLQRQVLAFATREEMEEMAHHLWLTHTPLSSLQLDTTLERSYTGGKVTATYSAHLTQGQVVLLLQDDPQSQKQLQCVFEGDVTRLLPASGRLMESEVYLHRVGVSPSAVEYSQDMELGLSVEGDEARVWVVSRDARKTGFLPSRDPKDFQGRKGAAKRARRRRNVEERERRERERREEERRERERRQETKDEEGRPLPHHSAAPPSSSLHPPSLPPPTTTTSAPPPPPSSSSHFATGPEPPPSQATPTSTTPTRTTSSTTSPSFPGTSNIPAYVLHNLTGADRERTHGDTSSQDADSSTSVEGISSEEGEEGREEEGGGMENHAWNAARKPYIYTKISELEAGQQKANVFGVVVDFKPPFQTKGRDFGSIVNIIDETSAENPLKCVFFHQNPEKLPKVRREGDIACFHRMSIKLFPSGLQGVGQSYTSSLCFSSRLGTKVKPLTGSFSYTFTSADRQRVRQLRVWNARRREGDLPFSSSYCSLKEVTPGVQFDLLCQVVTVSFLEIPDTGQAVLAARNSDRAVLQVWDGTTPAHRPVNLDLSLHTTRSNSDLVGISGSELTEYVVVYGQALSAVAKELSPGQFIFLRGVSTCSHARFNFFKDPVEALELRVVGEDAGGLKEAGMTSLSSKSSVIYNLKRRLRVAKRSLHFRPLPPDVVPSPITHSPHNQQHPIPLTAVTKRPHAASKFRCCVKLLSISPHSVEEMVKLHCPKCGLNLTVTPTTRTDTPCPHCTATARLRKHTPIMRHAYFMKLLLADETAHVHAYASGRQALSLLPMCPPVNFYNHPKERVLLLEQLYRMTGGCDPFDLDYVGSRRPWLGVCLVSMITQGPKGEEGERESVSYHLFDTILSCSDGQPE